MEEWQDGFNIAMKYINVTPKVILYNILVVPNNNLHYIFLTTLGRNASSFFGPPVEQLKINFNGFIRMMKLLCETSKQLLW